MINNLFVFEDDKYANFLPMAYLRPVYDLISGMSPLLAKIVRNFPEANIHLHCRDYLKNIVKQNHAGIGVNNINTGTGCLLVNGRLLAGHNIRKILTLDGKDRVFITENEEVAAAYLNTENLYLVRDMLDDVFTSRRFISVLRNKTEINHVSVKLMEFPWDLNNNNIEQIEEDFKAVVPAGIIKGDIHPQVSVLDEYKIFAGEGSRIYPGVILNAEKGPIYIGENSEIKPNTYIEGPVYVGNSTTINGGALLPGAAIGPKSYVSGEIANSIVHGYSRLDQVILRDSYLTDAVDMECHTYNRSGVSPFSSEPDIYITGEKVKTNQKILGLYVGDFSRVGPQVIINSGTVMGVSTYYEIGNDTMPRYLPSFLSQTSVNRYEEFTLKEVFEMTTYYLSQKEIELTKAERDLIEYVYSKFSYDRKTSKIIY